MDKAPDSPRKFFVNAVRGVGLVATPGSLQAQVVSPSDKKIVVGGHPDEPGCGAGDTIPLLVKAGHDVTLMYFTYGDEGIEGKSYEGAATIRRKESVESCKVLERILSSLIRWREKALFPMHKWADFERCCGLKTSHGVYPLVFRLS